MLVWSESCVEECELCCGVIIVLMWSESCVVE